MLGILRKSQAGGYRPMSSSIKGREKDFEMKRLWKDSGFPNKNGTAIVCRPIRS
jgi:hypothetical protein